MSDSRSVSSPTQLAHAERSLSSAERSALYRASVASAIGNFIEWFDYASYGYFATVLAAVFFPAQSKAAGLLATLLVFALSFLLRPIGAAVWGNLGDRYGRRAALAWSILIMSGSTFFIALTPGYATIGVLAPVLLLGLRLAQGFSASGEYAGAAAFLAEYAPEGNRGLVTSLVPASTGIGLLVGSLFATALHAWLSPQDLTNWGWRIPFLLAGPLGLVGRYIRLHLEDSPAYQNLMRRSQQETPRAPIRTIICSHGRALAIAFGVTCLNAVGFYLVLSYMPTYLTAQLGISDFHAFMASTIALAAYIGSVFLMGHLSDLLGRKRMLIAACVLFIVLTVPLFSQLRTDNFVVIVAVEVVFVILLSVNDGTLATFLAEVFPTSVRYTGFALAFNTANALLGGTAPAVTTWLISVTGSTMAPAYYLVMIAALALGAMLAARETAFVALPEGDVSPQDH